MNLIKIYDKTCDVCALLAGIDEEIADDYGMFFRQFTVEELAASTGHIRDYVVPVYVTPNDGMINLPIYLVETQDHKIQASGEIKTAEELINLIEAHKKWELSKNA